MLLSSVVNTVKRKSHRGSYSVTTDQTTSDIVQCVNEAAREVQRHLPKRLWWKSGTVAITAGVAGTPSVWSLPSDLQLLSTAYFTHNNALFILSKIDSDREWVGEVWNPITATTIPLYYRDIGPDGSGNKQIEIFPIPNFNFTLNIEYYRLKSADLTTSDLSSQIPDIPDQYQDVLEKGAFYWFLQGFDDPNMPKAKADYEEAILALNEADERNLDSNNAFRWPIRRYQLPGFRLS